jgi:hypothetical protein
LLSDHIGRAFGLVAFLPLLCRRDGRLFSSHCGNWPDSTRIRFQKNDKNPGVWIRFDGDGAGKSGSQWRDEAVAEAWGSPRACCGDDPTDQRCDDIAVILVQFFRFEADVLFAGGLLFLVFFDPGFKAFAGGGVAAGEFEAGDIAIGDGDFFVAVFGD